MDTLSSRKSEADNQWEMTTAVKVQCILNVGKTLPEDLVNGDGIDRHMKFRVKRMTIVRLSIKK